MSVWSNIQDRSTGEKTAMEDTPYFDEDISPDDFKEMLKKGIVNFKYQKKDGSTREAWGTKKMDIVSKIPGGGECPPKKAGYSIYFDLEKRDWRVFLDSRLIGVRNEIFSKDQYSVIYDKYLNK